MLFNSFNFLCIFLPITLLAIITTAQFGNRHFSLIILSLASAVFYAFYSIWHLLLLVCMLTINWFLVKHVNKKGCLALGISINLGVLLLFKYSGFVAQQFGVNSNALPTWLLTLPLAISFYTFHQISFLVDVSRGKVKRPDLLTYASYILLFPQLIAGPLIRYSEIGTQLGRRMPAFVEPRLFRIGFIFLVLGLAKKVLIADNLAPYVDFAFSHVQELSIMQAWQAALGFTFQIYFDFSGYTDMAIGLALMIGFRFPRNFNSPYHASNISDFWKRWHMTLSRFLRDYLYKPLGGNRRGLGRTLLNLMIVMLLGGLWHGANWTFIVWGGLHGGYLVTHRLWSRFSPIKMPVTISWAITFACVVIAWVFFRAPTVENALEMLKHMTMYNPVTSRTHSSSAAFTILIASVCMWALPRTRKCALKYHKSKLFFVLLGFVVSLCAIKMFVNMGHRDAFIYFAF